MLNRCFDEMWNTCWMVRKMRRSCAYIQWVHKVFRPLLSTSVILYCTNSLLVRFTQQKATKHGFLVHKRSSALVMFMKMKQLGSNLQHKQARWNFHFKCCIFLFLQSYFWLGSWNRDWETFWFKELIFHPQKNNFQLRTATVNTFRPGLVRFPLLFSCV